MGIRVGALVLGLVACGPSVALDAGSAIDASPALDAGSVAAAPALPGLGPCPEGWREVPGEPDGIVRCDPWPATGRRDDCGATEVHLPGAAGCARVGPECPTDGWPAELPTDRAIVFVDASGAGDGSSRTAPLASLEDAVASAPPDAVVAVRAGTYDVGALTPASGVTIWGACTSQTILTTSRASEAATITLEAARSGARALSIVDAETTAVLATGDDTFIEDVVIASALEHGIEAFGGSLRVERALVRDVRADATVGGDGLNAKGGAQVEILASAIERVRFAGILALGNGTHVTARDVVVYGTQSREFDRTKGRGIDVESGATATLERVVIDHARDAGLYVALAPSRCEARDLVIMDTQPEEASLEIGYGAVADEGSVLVLDRAWIVGSHEAGLTSIGAGALLEATDVIVERTLERVSTGAHGIGISANTGARLVVTRVAVVDSLVIGAQVTGVDTRIDGEDLVVLGVRGELATGMFGAGLWAQLGGAMRLSRVSIARVHTAGVAALTGSSVELEDLDVRGVELAACASTTCPERGGGFGVSSHLGADVTATRFHVAESAVCGVAIGEAASLDLARGVIAGAPVGACVQVDGYDTSRLRNEVEYREVGVPLQATTYALPDQDVL